MRVFNTLIFILTFQFSFACVENYATTENVRIALFEAKRKGFSGLTPFYYSANRYYNTSNDSFSDSDYFTQDSFSELRNLNCLEWKKKLGNQIKVEDIYNILYKTNAEEIINAYENKSLAKIFKKNTFINTLLSPTNRELLDCLLFAKKIEYNSNRWSFNSYSVDIKKYEQKLLKTSDKFLELRYAFLILKYNYYKQNSKEVLKIYNTYFGKNVKTVLEYWALDYIPQSLNKSKSSYYSLHNFFISSNYKPSLIIYDKDINATLHEAKLAENNFVKSVDIAIDNFDNPGRCLEQIQEIAKVSPNNFLLAFLIGREINKVEDWIFTPQYTNHISSVVYDYQSDFEKAKKENYAKDILYLRKLRSFLIAMRRQTSCDQKDFVTVAIAQLYFIDNEIDKGKQYTNLITDGANPSIQMQKNIQLALITLKQSNLNDKEVQNQLARYFKSVENQVIKDKGFTKCIYSLYSIASEEFSRHGNEALAGLFFIKAQLAKDKSIKFDYDYIGYLERHVDIKNAKKLISLYSKKNKTPFEKFITTGTMKKDVNFYKDLLGTIAFRNNNLKLAQQVFKSIPIDFWIKNVMYKNFLNENPFEPKVLQQPKDRNYNYAFNKADFVSKLIQLEKENTSESYKQLANAYFNVSFFGNSWAMVAYDKFNIFNYLFDYRENNQNLKEKYQMGNYYDLTIAKKYYEKALKLSKSNEEKALASLMIFKCKYARYEFSRFKSYNPYYNFPIENEMKYRYPLFYEYFYRYAENYKNDYENTDFRETKELINFYSIYKSTETFKKYNCPMLKEFIN